MARGSFRRTPGLAPLSGRLQYHAADTGFGFAVESGADYEARAGQGWAALLVDQLRITFGLDDGVLLYPWGPGPHTRWWRGVVPAPPSTRVGLSVDLGRAPELGHEYDVLEGAACRTLYDPRSGWVRIYDLADTAETGSEFVEFAQDCVLEIRDGRFRGIWLHPRIIGALEPPTPSRTIRSWMSNLPSRRRS
jgi:hypothetical protein